MKILFQPCSRTLRLEAQFEPSVRCSQLRSAPETTTRKKVRLLNQDQKGNLLSRHDQRPTSRTTGYSRQNKWPLSILSSCDIKWKPLRNNRFSCYIFCFFWIGAFWTWLHISAQTNKQTNKCFWVWSFKPNEILTHAKRNVEIRMTESKLFSYPKGECMHISVLLYVQ